MNDDERKASVVWRPTIIDHVISRIVASWQIDLTRVPYTRRHVLASKSYHQDEKSGQGKRIILRRATTSSRLSRPRNRQTSRFRHFAEEI